MLFKAAIIPGILPALVKAVYCVVCARKHVPQNPTRKFSIKKVGVETEKAIRALLMPVLPLTVISMFVYEAVGFNDMASAPERLFTPEQGLKAGCVEVGVMPTPRPFFGRKCDAFQKEVSDVVQPAERYSAPAKLIIETGYMTDDEKVLISRLGLEAGMSFIKLSSGMAKAPRPSTTSRC